MKLNLTIFFALLSIHFPNSRTGLFSVSPTKVGLSVDTESGLYFDCTFEPKEKVLLTVEIVKPSNAPVKDVEKVNAFLKELLQKDSLYYKRVVKPCGCGTQKLHEHKEPLLKRDKKINEKPKSYDGIKRA